MQINSNPAKIDFTKLESFVYNHPNANFFQSTKAFNFFNEVNNYEPILIVAEEDNEIVGSLLAVIIKEGNGIKGYLSKRCIIWGGPLVKLDDETIYYSLLKKLDDLVKNKAIYTEFRNFTDLSGMKPVFNDYHYEFNEHLNFIVSIPSFDEAKANISKSKKRQINKSITSGAEIIEASEEQQIKEFYNILIKLYKEKVGKPLPDYELFQKFFQNKDLGKYLLIRYKERIIGGIMCPIYKDKIYEWYVCGLDGEFDNIFPSVLATWAPIEYAATNGLKYFDFMGAGKPDEDYGVREFKSKFGGELVNYGRFRKINSPMKYKVGELGVKVLGKFLNENSY